MLFPEKSASPRSPHLLEVNRSVLLIIDAQEGFRKAIPDFDAVAGRIALLAKAAARLGVPVLVTEQYPKALGPTANPVAAALPEGIVRFEKLCFSACDAPEWASALQAHAKAGRDQWILCGVEAHVCVLQTALDLVGRDGAAHAVEDAVSSRRESDKAAALRRMEAHGVAIATTEMVVFEWLRRAGTEDFKALQALVK